MKRKRTSVFCVLALLAVLLPVSARADMGPKPSVTIHVKNPPSGSYYLDLLVPGEASDKLFDNQDWNHLSEKQMDAGIITNLRTAARDAGGEGTWHLAMLDGTRAPMYGEIQSTDDTFRYDYHGVPDEFRIVIATKDGARLSFVQQRYRLWQEFTYDYAANMVLTGNSWSDYAKQFLSSLLPTLLIEGLLLIPFGFWDERNRRAFLCVNVATQLVLTAVTAWCMAQDVVVFCLCAARACHLDCGGRHLPQNAQERTSVAASGLLCAVRKRPEHGRDVFQHSLGIPLGLRRRSYAKNKENRTLGVRHRSGVHAFVLHRQQGAAV